MKKIIFCFVSLFYLLTNAVAQTDTSTTIVSPTLRGAILNENNTPLPYVNQFDKNLWKNQTTIEPTQQMKEYKKIE